MREILAVGMHGDISFRQLESGVWVARTRFRDKTGVRRDVTARGATRGRSQTNLLAKLQGYQPRSSGAVQSASTVSALLDYWLEYTRDEVVEGTHAYRMSAVRALKEKLGGYRLHEVTPAVVADVIDELAIKREAPGGKDRGGVFAARAALIAIRQAFDLAVRFDAVSSNPAARLKSPARSEGRREPRALTLEEVAQVRERVGLYVGVRRNWRSAVYLVDLVDFMLATGCRIGEALAVRREDVVGDVVTFRHIRTQHGNFERTKNGRVRSVKLPGWVLPMVRGRLLRSPVEGCFLFWNSVGRQVSNSSAHVALRSALGDEFGWVSSHTFRKTVATHLAGSLSAAEVALQLGNTARVAEVSYIARPVVADWSGVLGGLG